MQRSVHATKIVEKGRDDPPQLPFNVRKGKGQYTTSPSPKTRHEARDYQYPSQQLYHMGIGSSNSHTWVMIHGVPSAQATLWLLATLLMGSHSAQQQLLQALLTNSALPSCRSA